MMRRTLYFVVMLCLIWGSLGAFGVPPWTGEAHAAGTTYYLSPNGNNANDGLSPSTAWATLKRAAHVLKAGDTLLLMGGTYVSDPSNTEFFFSPSNSGTAENPITIKAYDGEVPVITGASPYGSFITFSDVSHFIVEGIHFENTTNGYPIYSRNANHITIRNNVFRNTNSSQVVVNGSHYVIENNVFDTAGSPAGEGSGDNVYLIGTTYSLVQNNYFTRGGHYAVDVINDEGPPKEFAHHNIIRNNYIDQYWGGGIGVIRGSTQTLVEKNFIKNAGIGVVTYPKTGIQLAAEQAIIRNNIITRPGSATKADSGISVSSYRISGIDQNVLDSRVYNNNIYKSGKEPLVFSQRGATQLKDNKFLNNIIYYNRLIGDYNPYWPAGNYYITVETYHAFDDNKWPFFPNDNYIYNNILLHADENGEYPGEDPFIFYDQGDQFPVCYCNGWGKSLAEVETDYPAYIYGNIEQNPLYAGAEGDDFSLQTGSPAIDAGAHLAQTTASGVNTTVVPVDDPWFFFDGYGIVEGDTIKIGSNAPVTITSVDTAAGTITVDAPVTFNSGDYVDLVYNGAGIDLGALESGDVPWTPVLADPQIGDGEITLSWGTSSGAAGYKVKYGTASGSYTTVMDVGGSTSATIDGLTNGTTYYFAVSAYNANGESADSFEKYGKPHVLPPAPDAPVQNDPVAGNGKVTVSWNAVVGADGYNVKYGTVSGTYTNTVRAGNVTSRTITGLSNGTTYYFVVTAYNEGGESGVSNEKSAVPELPPPPAAPVQLQPAPGDGQVRISWTAVSGADGYRVKYGTASGSYTSTANAGGSTSTTITGLTNGTTYYFVVVAYNAGGESGNSNEQSATPQPAPAAPTLDAPIAGDGRVSLSWSAVSGAVGYKVRYGTSSGGPYGTTIDVGSSTEVTIDELMNDTAYYFVVTAYNALGSESAYSAERSATPRSADGSITVLLKNGVNGYTGSESFGIRSEAPDTHYGSDGYGHWVNNFPGRNYYAIRAFYKFDISPPASGIPADAIIESAELKLYVNYGIGTPINLYRMAPVNDAFAVDYAAATRNTYDGVNAWTGGGNGAGDPNDTDNDFIDTPDAQATPTSLGYVSMDVTAAVQAWHGGASNNGWMVNTASASAQLGSAHDAFGPTHYPELIIRYKLPQPEDVTPPVTQAELAGIQGDDRWYTSEVIVTLTAEDDVSGVQSTEYKLIRLGGASGAEAYEPYTEPIVLEDGEYELYYRSTDHAGNAEEARVLNIRVDAAAPNYNATVNGVPLTDGAVFSSSDQLLLELRAEDHGSGILQQAVTWDGVPVDSGMTVVLAGRSGVHTIGIVVADQAGNRSESAYEVRVDASVDALQRLIERYAASGELGGPLQPQLTNKLKQAEHHWNKGHIEHAIKHLGDFLRAMENPPMQQHISAEAKTALTADANALIHDWSEHGT
jgi:hypothetical protein